MSSGLSKTRLDRLHEMLSGHVERGEVSGLVAAVSRHGETHVDHVGNASFGGAPVRRDTIFRIASMTKPVAAVAALALVEEGRLRLDDPVDALLPELANRQVLRRIDGELDDTEPAQRPITLRDVLTFRLGLGMVMTLEPVPIVRALAERGFPQGPPRPQEVPAPDEVMRRLGEVPLLFQPGDQWAYNTGSDVLGVLVARAAGQPFDTFLRDRIFEPLGMKDTGFFVPADVLDRFTTSYWNNFATGNLEVFDERDGQWTSPPAFPSGAGGLVSTIDDYLAFAQMLLNGGVHKGERILGRPTIEAMTADQLTEGQKARTRWFPPDFFESHGWGFGVSVATRRTDPWAPLGTYGWDGGLGTCWRNDPSEDMTTIILTTRAFTSPQPPAVCADFWAGAYAAIDD